MALITSAPATIKAKISAVFTSVAQLTEQSDRINLILSFTDADGNPIYGVKAVYTDEDDQIEALSTQKSYGVFFKPVVSEGSASLTAEFMDEEYTGTADLTDADVLLGVDALTFSKED